MSEHRPDIHRADIAQSLASGTVAANAVGKSLDRKADRSTVWIAACIAALVSSAISIAVAVPGAIDGARQQAERDNIASAQTENRERADAAYAAAESANAELRRRGQPEVPVPEPDGSGDILDTLVPAAVAGTLAALPAQLRTPTADDLGRAVAGYMAINPPPGPSPTQIADAVSAFLRANPPPTGDAGQDGARGVDCSPDIPACVGPPPTAEAIRAAVADELAANPDILCTSTGGTWTKLPNVVQDATPNDDGLLNPDATTVTIWACVPSE